MELAVIGGSEFTLGFALTGIRHIVVVDTDVAAAFKRVMHENNIGIVITDEATMGKLDDDNREQVEQSMRPVVVVLSTEGTQESLRRLIRKSIGVDLLKE